MARYVYTQESGTDFKVSIADKCDALEDSNQVRQILDDLGELLGHSKFDDSYPADGTSGGDIDIRRVTTKSAVATLTTAEAGFVKVSAAAGYSLTLPTAVGNKLTYIFVKTDANTNLITIDGAGTETINGSLTYTDLNYQYAYVAIRSDNANWFVLFRSTNNIAVTTGKLSQFAPTTSAELAGVISDETGSGLLVFGTAPTITTINLTGGQIAFPATQAPSAGANTLDDYEEGTWTGELKGTTTSATTPVTATGYYTKIGRKVTCAIYFANGDTTGATGNMIVIGLPFTSLNQATCRNTGIAITYGLEILGLFLAGYIAENSTIINFLCPNNNAAWLVPLITAGATKYLQMSITYFTD